MTVHRERGANPAPSRERPAMLELLGFIYTILQLYIYVLIAAAILSWLIAFNVVNMRNQLVAGLAQLLYAVTEPVLRPIRNILPNLGGIDISPGRGDPDHHLHPERHPAESRQAFRLTSWRAFAREAGAIVLSAPADAEVVARRNRRGRPAVRRNARWRWCGCGRCRKTGAANAAADATPRQDLPRAEIGGYDRLRRQGPSEAGAHRR